MKWLAFFALLAASAHAQTRIHLVLVTNRPIEKVEAYDGDQTEHLEARYQDTVLFSFHTKAPTFYRIGYREADKNRNEVLWLDPGDDTVVAHLQGDKLVIDTVMGSPTYYTVKSFQRAFNIAVISDTARRNAFLLKAYEDNIGNLYSYAIGSIYLVNNNNNRPALLRLKALVDRQGKSLDWSLWYRGMAERLNAELTIAHIPMANFSLLDRKGKAATISLAGADTYVLDFWFLACGPCVKDHHRIKAMETQLREHRVNLIGISIDQRDQRKTWNAYLAENGYGWPNYLDTRGDLSGFLSLHEFPTYVVLDGQGNIKGTYNNFGDVLKGVGMSP